MIVRACIAIGALTFAHAACADVTAFDTAASFSAVVSNIHSFDFSGLNFPASINAIEGSRTVGGATFTSPGTGFSFTIKANYGGATYGADFFSGQSPNASPSEVLVTFAGLSAISFEYGSYVATPGSPITITLSSGEQFTRNLPVTPGTSGFIGLVSSTPITSVLFTTISNASAPNPFAYSMDIVRFQTASPVPENAPWLMLGAGLALMRMIIVRRGSGDQIRHA